MEGGREGAVGGDASKAWLGTDRTSGSSIITHVPFLPPSLPLPSPTEDIVTGTSNLIAIVKENDVFVKNAGEYPWGSVQAPDWALPVAAFATLSFGVLIPLILKPGVDAFNTGK